MTITINFQFPIQDSVSVGDVAYYVYTGTSGGFDINSANLVEIGEIIEISRASTLGDGLNNNYIVCNTDLYGNELEIGCDKHGEGQQDCGEPFILFSKNNCQNLKSLLGYYAKFRFVNNSKDKAELFNVTVDMFESSK